MRLIVVFSLLMLSNGVRADNLLQFNPPDMVNMKVSAQTVRVETRNGHNIADTTTSMADSRIFKTSTGWTVTTKVTSMRITPDTDSLKKILSDLLIGTETSLYINRQGAASGGSGYDTMLSRLDTGTKSPMKAAIRQVFTPKALAAKDQSDWNMRVGELVGRPFKVGRIETSQAEGPSESGSKLSLLSATVIEDTVRQNGVLCIKVGRYSDTDPTRLSAALHKSVPEVFALFHLTDSSAVKLKQQEVEYSSHLHMTMDAATLLVKSETMVRTMTVAVPGKDGTTNKRQTQETVEKAISYY